jgi:hypothetical protein
MRVISLTIGMVAALLFGGARVGTRNFFTKAIRCDTDCL